MPTESLFSTLRALLTGGRRLVSLRIEGVRLKAAEKLTLLLSTVIFSAVVAALAIGLAVFAIIGVGLWLATIMPAYLVFMIIALFLLLVLILIIALRRYIFDNPIARFVTQLLLEPDTFEEDNN